MTTSYNHGLFAFFDNFDVMECLMGCCCAPCRFGENMNKAFDEDCVKCGVMFCCCSLCVGGIQRGKLRSKYDLKEEPFNDFLVYCCFGCCAICQEAHEIEYRGSPAFTNIVKPPGAPGLMAAQQ